MPRETTTIQISHETYQRLSGRKKPGDSFEDVISRVLDEVEGSERLSGEEVEPANFYKGSGDRKGPLVEDESTSPRDERSSGASETNVYKESSGNDQENNKSERDSVAHEEPIPGKQSQLFGATESESSSDGELDVDKIIQELDLQTSASTSEWVPPVRAAYDFIGEEGEALKGDFVEELYAEYPISYDDSDSWWKVVILPALRAHPLVRTPDPGQPWEYDPDKTNEGE